jgi:hypothetical protein
MLSTSKMTGFLFTKDYDNARVFFHEKMGFEFVSQDQFALVMKAGANNIRIAKVPNFTPAQGTVLGWEVEEIEEVVDWLKGRGVVFEDFPFIQDHTLRIWTAPGGDQVAWFKDADGNILSVHHHAPQLG